MQARRGFVLFPIGKPATGEGLIEVRFLKMKGLVIDLRMITKIRKSFFPAVNLPLLMGLGTVLQGLRRIALSGLV
jgi:hypothetical protein